MYPKSFRKTNRVTFGRMAKTESRRTFHFYNGVTLDKTNSCRKRRGVRNQGRVTRRGGTLILLFGHFSSLLTRENR